MRVRIPASVRPREDPPLVSRMARNARADSVARAARGLSQATRGDGAESVLAWYIWIPQRQAVLPVVLLLLSLADALALRQCFFTYQPGHRVSQRQGGQFHCLPRRCAGYATPSISGSMGVVGCHVSPPSPAYQQHGRHCAPVGSRACARRAIGPGFDPPRGRSSAGRP